MINYILIIIADIFLALNFVAQKKYQTEEGNSSAAGVFYNMAVGLISAVIFVFIGKFNITLTWYSFIMAIAQTALVTIYTMISFMILKEGNISLYTLFLLTGGMVLPYIFGVLFLEERLTFARTVGLALIVAAIAMSNTGIQKPSKKQIFLCILVFVLNGFVSIISKLHQTEDVCKIVSSENFVFWTNCIKFLMCIPIFAVVNKGSDKRYKPSLKKSAMPVILSSLFGGISYCLQLVGAENIPATVLYPLLSGGSIILSTLIGFMVLHEKPSREQVACIGICFVGTCLFL